MYSGTDLLIWLGIYQRMDGSFRKATNMAVRAFAKPRLEFTDPVLAFHTDSVPFILKELMNRWDISRLCFDWLNANLR